MSFAASTKLLIESKGILQSRFVIPVVISDKRILLLKHEHFTKAEVDSSAIKRTISEYKEAEVSKRKYMSGCYAMGTSRGWKQ
jgi:hypothetical protein